MNCAAGGPGRERCSGLRLASGLGLDWGCSTGTWTPFRIQDSPKQPAEWT
eukprot:CAMPEP_0206468096 /NCGR_PEP_ID=MMETSP0324_2-20121206/29416_1 /ASSEMBLY_ACC=CAM_ASM_000836 /TAXON_ID=2866 /ORGANISM="Crypthecodinium cohnii, Strain Seligo" /LENGTH=49 /DNA_ID=CAMNT_0053941469 /DNA_START=90 /DNA_END=239 /DNA_ORIENTATION=-